MSKEIKKIRQILNGKLHQSAVIATANMADKLRPLTIEQRFEAICKQISKELHCPLEYLTITQRDGVEKLRGPAATFSIGDRTSSTIFVYTPFERNHFKYIEDNGELVGGYILARRCAKLVRKENELRKANQQIADLVAENAELRLFPGGPEYREALARFDAMKISQ